MSREHPLPSPTMMGIEQREISLGAPLIVRNMPSIGSPQLSLHSGMIISSGVARMNQLLCGQPTQPPSALDSLLYLNALEPYRPTSINQLYSSHLAIRSSQLRPPHHLHMPRQDPAMLSLLYSYRDSPASTNLGNYLSQANSLNRAMELHRLLAIRSNSQSNPPSGGNSSDKKTSIRMQPIRIQ